MRNEISVDFMLKKPVGWLSPAASGEDIALSSRIRLARNFSGISFPINTSDSERMQVLEAVSKTVAAGGIFNETVLFDIIRLSDIDRLFLLERHLISRDFCKALQGRALILEENESLGMMVNEEDHIRMQIIKPGMCLQEIWQIIDNADNILSSNIPYAFNDTLGYLTSCPTNVGTGMRASVMLNLTGLALLGHINGVIQGAGKLGLAVRGLYGEGSEGFGNLYQVSNQSTLGESETQIIQRMGNIINQIILHEKNAREILLQTRKNYLLDLIGRAFGTLCYAYVMTLREALNSLSLLRVGVDLNMFASLKLSRVNELFIDVQDAHLQKCAGKILSAPDRDVLRAEFIRSKLKQH